MTALILNAVPSLALNSAFDDKIRDALNHFLRPHPVAVPWKTVQAVAKSLKYLEGFVEPDGGGALAQKTCALSQSWA